MYGLTNNRQWVDYMHADKIAGCEESGQQGDAPSPAVHDQQLDTNSLHAFHRLCQQTPMQVLKCVREKDPIGAYIEENSENGTTRNPQR